MAGYPKFDAVDAFERPQPRLFENDRMTVLYSPHPSPHLSSWYTHGEQILDFFLHSSEYNLPFLFIDVHETDWVDDPNYLQWKAGPVITSADDLGTRLGEAVATHSEFRKVQDEIFAYSIEIGDKSSSERAAGSNLQFLFGSTG